MSMRTEQQIYGMRFQHTRTERGGNRYFVDGKPMKLDDWMAARGIAIVLQDSHHTEETMTDAYDAAREIYERTRDALKLAEQAKEYRDGEQWAVSAVLFLRRETARTLRNACTE